MILHRHEAGFRLGMEARSRMNGNRRRAIEIIDRCQQEVWDFAEKHQLDPDEITKFRAKKCSKALNEVRGIISLS